MELQKKDVVFLILLTLGILALLALVNRRPLPLVMASETVPNETEMVGMSLSPDRNPPDASPFKGRYVMPPPLASIMPSITSDATSGTALNQKGYLQ